MTPGFKVGAVTAGGGSRLRRYGELVVGSARLGATTCPAPPGPSTSRGSGAPATPTRVGRDCWIGAHAVVTDGSEIGDGAVVGAGAVVTRPVPPGVVVGGVPARPLAPRTDRPEPQQAASAGTAAHGPVRSPAARTGLRPARPRRLDPPGRRE